MRRNDDYKWWLGSAVVQVVAYIIWFLEDHRTWKNPWVMVAFFSAAVLLDLIVGFIKWRRFQKENG